MTSESPCDTDQVSVGHCWGRVRLKVLIGGHFRWCLTVTLDGQEAEQQQHPAEHPGAVHGAGGGGCQEETEKLGVAGGLQESLPEPLLSYRDPQSPALPTGGMAGRTSHCWSHSKWRELRWKLIRLSDFSPEMNYLMKKCLQEGKYEAKSRSRFTFSFLSVIVTTQIHYSHIYCIFWLFYYTCRYCMLYILFILSDLIYIVTFYHFIIIIKTFYLMVSFMLLKDLR